MTATYVDDTDYEAEDICPCPVCVYHLVAVGEEKCDWCWAEEDAEENAALMAGEQRWEMENDR